MGFVASGSITILLERRFALPGWSLARVLALPATTAAALYAIALLVRVSAVNLIHFPMSEGSAYYFDVARNFVNGRGLVIDAIWSYATPPLALPRPAFELWQPMASVLAAIPMTQLDATFDAARLGGVLAGALLAPLAWLVARDAATRLRLPDIRSDWLAAGAGLLAAVAGPFVFATAVPDSTLPFTVFGVAACVAIPRAVAGDRRALIALGLLLGLAYLTRMEAIWIGLAFAFIALVSSTRPVLAVARVAVAAAVAALIALPWWMRNMESFGTPLPGQVTDNMLLTRNEQIFAWLEPPTFVGFLTQGAFGVVGSVVRAAWHDAVNVLLIPAAPIVTVAALTIGTLLWRHRRALSSARATLPANSPLAALLLSGAITFVAATLLFPVATLWGTFEHAAGPFLVGLIVVALLGGDALVAWLVQRRSWQRTNAWLAPLALVALTVPLSLLQIGSAARQASQQAAELNAIALAVPERLTAMGVPDEAPIITDHPVWISDATGRPALALPDEPVTSVLDLARRFGARSVLVMETRGAYPGLLERNVQECFSQRFPAGEAALFVIDRECLK
ncbi:MAG: glycosyltransferase family 39 protein [Candidatus Limnocylindrales bacterium]